jgi:hypothetical protein
MKTYVECIPCFVNQTLSVLHKISPDAKVREKTVQKVLHALSAMDLRLPPPVMAQRIHRIMRKTIGNGDPFAREKSEYNHFAMSLIPEIRKRHQDDADLLLKTLRLSIAGNIIDSGKNPAIRHADVLQSLDRSMEIELDMKAVDRLRSSINGSSAILYLGDNAGEIVFDRLFIECMPCKKVTYVVRGAPVINDVTLQDAREVKMCDLVGVIDNGSDAPGTILEDCSSEFQKRFASADLIIAKGQGNYETLNEVNKKIYFLFQAKCPVIARDAGCEVGSFVVKAPYAGDASQDA